MSKHVIQYLKSESPKKRLFCFPYAGSGAAVYRQWAPLLPPDVELYAIEIPGRVHLKEKTAADMKELVEVIYPEILPLLDLPYAFFGHSYGSIMAYELARKLQEEQKPLPIHLFVSSRRPPHISPKGASISHLPDTEFIKEIQIQFGAIPEAVLKDKTLLAMFLPILKEDLRINEQYLGSIEPPLTIPVTFYHGMEDGSGALFNTDKWSEVTTGPFTTKIFPGGHFYIDTARKALIDDIIRIIS